jgi:lysozyme family protein
MSNFSKCLEVILHHEGGYVNHPKDPGGETNLGVTKRVYEEFGGTKDMKDLTQEDVEPIYDYEKPYRIRL